MSERAHPTRLLDVAPLAAVARLAAPTTVVMAVSAVSNVVYTYFVSRLGVDAIGAVSLVFPVSLLAVTAMGGGIGAGATSAIARALGAGERHEAAALAGQALVLAVALGLGFGVAAWLGVGTLFGLMGASGAVHEGATAFARVLFGGVAITFFGMMLDGVMRAEGNVRTPATWATTSLVAQMAVTPLFMFRFGWGLIGGALAMLACQASAIVPRLFWVFGGRGAVRPALRSAHAGLDPVREIVRVGVPAALSTSVNNVGLMVLTGVVARLGAPDLAAYGLGTRLDFVLMSLAYGVGAAVLTLVGLAAGATREDRIQEFVGHGVVIVVLLLAVPGLVVWWRPALWLAMFSDDPGVLAVGSSYFRMIAPTYPFVGVSMVVAFAFQGLGRAALPLVVSIARIAAVLIAAIVSVRLGFDEHAVFLCIALGNVAGAIALGAIFVATCRARVPTAR
ncbi:MAG: MATE family efflux transporter [Deltaproteobacteria bacterium]|nr:MATE family efflux transporter [Deltaproteobacteria bacterium]